MSVQTSTASHDGTKTSAQRAASGPTRSAAKGRGWIFVWSMRAIILAAALCAWQWVPQIPNISDTVRFADPFFISSPSLIAQQLQRLATGAEGATSIWGPLVQTVGTALAGTILALIAGAVLGLAVSNWATLAKVLHPFLIVLNAVPKVAIIPIIVILATSSTLSDMLVAFFGVFFLAFYNSAEGGSSVAPELVHNARLLGCNPWRIMWRVRWPYSLAWTLATLPNAIAFGLTATVTAELFTGGEGLGYQLVLGIDNSNATLLFAIVVLVAVIGVVLVLSGSALRRVLVPWRETSEGA